MPDLTGILATMGMVSVAVALVVLGFLSRRLGRVTRAAAYYYGFFVAALLVSAGAAGRLYHLIDGVASPGELADNMGWVLLIDGAPAAGVTLGVIVAWRYWSWLMAERD